MHQRHSTQRHLVFICSLLLVLAVSCQALFAAPPKPSRVLVINSYHDGYRGSDDMQDGFISTLRKGLPNVDLTVEYLDAKHHSGPDYQRKLLELLQFKYQKRPFDLIFASDDDAFNLLESHRDRLFPGVPVIFAGTNFFDQSRLQGRQLIAGVDERPSFDQTLQLLLQLQPGTREILVVRDDSLPGRINADAFQKASAPLQEKIRFTSQIGRAHV